MVDVDLTTQLVHDAERRAGPAEAEVALGAARRSLSVGDNKNKR